jgi:hypothetical protein
MYIQQIMNPTLLSSTKRIKWHAEPESGPRKRFARASPHCNYEKSPFKSAKNLSPFAGRPRSRRGEGERSAANTLVVAKSCDRRPCAQCELFIRFFLFWPCVCVCTAYVVVARALLRIKERVWGRRVREWVLFYYNGMWNWHASNNK